MGKVMKKVSEAALAREGSPIDLRGTVLSVGFSARHKFHMSATQNNAAKIAEAIQALYGVKLTVNAVPIAEDGAVDGTPRRRVHSRSPCRRSTLRRTRS